MSEEKINLHQQSLGCLKHFEKKTCNLREIRSKKGINQKDFALMIGLTHGRLNQIESGEALPSKPVQILAELIDKGLYAIPNDTINIGSSIVSVYSSRPGGYDRGAWQIEATLSKVAQKTLEDCGFPSLWFLIPKTERVSISNNMRFTDILINENQKIIRKGKFVNRVWQANLYITENPFCLSEDDLDAIALKAEGILANAIETAFNDYTNNIG